MRRVYLHRVEVAVAAAVGLRVQQVTVLQVKVMTLLHQGHGRGGGSAVPRKETGVLVQQVVLQRVQVELLQPVMVDQP